MKAIDLIVIIVLYFFVGGLFCAGGMNNQLERCGKMSEINLDDYTSIVLVWPAFVGSALLLKEVPTSKCLE